MQDKTPIYLLSILGIVIVVGAIVMIFSTTNTTPQFENSEADNSMTGNVVFDSSAAPNLNVFGKIFFMAFLVGVVAYMYFKVE